MSPCCSCSEILNEQTGAYFCGGCGAPVASTGLMQTGPKMDSPSLRATDDYSAAKATAPRVSLDDMQAKIDGEYYFSALDGIDGRFRGGPEAQGCRHAPELQLLTICVLVMRNGFTVIGKSAPASPENFDEEKGRRFAYEDAIKQLWPLEGYARREKLSAGA